MINLKDRQWEEFLLSDVFIINSTSSSIDKIKLNGKKGQYPYITRSENNNGINDFIAEQPNYKLDSGNCITVGLDTQTAFYQSVRFYTGQNIQILRNDRLNAENAKFIIPMLKNSMTVFSWGGNGATLGRLKRSKILLPVDDNEEPDWQFMEDCAHTIEHQLISDYIRYKMNR